MPKRIYTIYYLRMFHSLSNSVLKLKMFYSLPNKTLHKYSIYHNTIMSIVILSASVKNIRTLICYTRNNKY